MFKHFAKPLNIEIPSSLQPYVMGCIQALTEGNIEVKYPMFATGFPILIHSTNDLPTIIADGKSFHPSSNLNLGGQIHASDIYLDFAGTVNMIGIIFHPLAPYYFFHQPGIELINRWTALEYLSSKTNFLSENLNTITSVIDRVSYIFKFLEIHLSNPEPAIPWLDQTVNTILAKNGIVEIDELITNSGLGPRHFRRQFKKIVGMPPKVYTKVIQLNTVFRLIEQGHSDQLLHIALDAGFYDQSHFINTFKQTIGDSPTQFLNSEHSFLTSYLGGIGANRSRD